VSLFSRNDVYLLGGLAIAGFVLFAEPIGDLLDMAYAVDNGYGLQLMPALVVLAAVLIFHLQRKRHQMLAAAIAAEADARAAERRAREMEQLVAFGQALARSLDHAAIEKAAAQHLRGLSGDLRPAAEAMLAVSRKNADLFHEVRENSVRDALTGCVNRKHALEVMHTALRRARRSKQPVTLLLFDLDGFKGINDRCGHLCGDAVLAAVGARMHAVLRGSDLKCRYGGEEFLVLLPDTPLAGAERVAETLRRELEANPVDWRGEAIVVTASFGVTQALPDEIDAEAIIGRADAAMYRAKAQGRNRVLVDTAVTGFV